MQTKYELKGYCTSDKTLNRNPSSRLLNAVIEGINNRDHLPNYLVPIIDDNLVVHAEIGDFVIRCILLEITKAFLHRRDMLNPKRKLIGHIKASVKAFTNMKALNMDNI